MPLPLLQVWPRFHKMMCKGSLCLDRAVFVHRYEGVHIGYGS